jgi:hypothetical protein
MVEESTIPDLVEHWRLFIDAASPGNPETLMSFCS